MTTKQLTATQNKTLTERLVTRYSSVSDKEFFNILGPTEKQVFLTYLQRANYYINSLGKSRFIGVVKEALALTTYVTDPETGEQTEFPKYNIDEIISYRKGVIEWLYENGTEDLSDEVDSQLSNFLDARALNWQLAIWKIAKYWYFSKTDPSSDIINNTSINFSDSKYSNVTVSKDIDTNYIPVDAAQLLTNSGFFSWINGDDGYLQKEYSNGFLTKTEFAAYVAGQKQLAEAINIGDSTTLASANTYTDTKTADLEDIKNRSITNETSIGNTNNLIVSGQGSSSTSINIINSKFMSEDGNYQYWKGTFPSATTYNGQYVIKAESNTFKLPTDITIISQAGNTNVTSDHIQVSQGTTITFTFNDTREIIYDENGSTLNINSNNIVTIPYEHRNTIVTDVSLIKVFFQNNPGLPNSGGGVQLIVSHKINIDELPLPFNSTLDKLLLKIKKPSNQSELIEWQDQALTNSWLGNNENNILGSTLNNNSPYSVDYLNGNTTVDLNNKDFVYIKSPNTKESATSSDPTDSSKYYWWWNWDLQWSFGFKTSLPNFPAITREDNSITDSIFENPEYNNIPVTWTRDVVAEETNFNSSYTFTIDPISNLVDGVNSLQQQVTNNEGGTQVQVESTTGTIEVFHELGFKLDSDEDEDTGIPDIDSPANDDYLSSINDDVATGLITFNQRPRIQIEPGVYSNVVTEADVATLITQALAPYLTIQQDEQYRLNQFAKDTEQDNNIQALANGEGITLPDGTQATLEGTDIAVTTATGTYYLEFDRDETRASGSADPLFENVQLEIGDVLIIVGDNTTGLLRYTNMVYNGDANTFGRPDYVFVTPHVSSLEIKGRDVIVDNNGTIESKYCGVLIMNKAGTKDISLKYQSGNGGILTNYVLKIYKDKGSAFANAVKRGEIKCQ